MPTAYTQIDSNIRKTWFLMALFLVLVIAVGFYISEYYGSPSILYIAVIFSVVMNISAYWYSDKIVMKLAGAREITHEEDQEIFHLVENLAITSGMPLPKIFLITDPAPNAFATGRDKEHGAIAITTGLRDILDKTEMEGVIAHELSHIRNHDTLIATVIVVLVGLLSILSDIFVRSRYLGVSSRNEKQSGPLAIFSFILILFSPIIATIIQLAISRKREFLADSSAVLLTRYPEGLARALKKISSYGMPMKRVHSATAHLFISNPFGSKTKFSFAKMFMTHPPVEERIRALLGDQNSNVL